jgi:hypothetical protein
MSALRFYGKKVAQPPLTGKLCHPHIGRLVGCRARLRDGFAAPRPESEL